MPPYFKALTTIIVWILLVWGCIILLGATIDYYVRIGIWNEPTFAHMASWAVSVGALILSVCAMKLRQMLE
jgi:hypothetical protein